MELPQKNKGLELTSYEGKESDFRVIEKPIPNLKAKDVLIKMYGAPINPSDLMFVRGLYGIKKKLPAFAGFEGSGTVVAVGSEVRFLQVGMDVSCTSSTGDGTWAEYTITAEENCIPLIDDVTLEEGACFFVNPLTAVAMVDIVKSSGSKALVQTAAASSLGQMLYKYSKTNGLEAINIVRKPEQEEILRSIGAEHILNSNDKNFESNLKKLSKKLEATVLLDAVAGELSFQILAALPYGSKMISYGALSEQSIPVNAGLMIFQNKKIEGFWLSSWIYNKGYQNVIELAQKAQKYLKTDLRTEIKRKFLIEEGYQALDYYKNNMTGGKILIVPR